jgi:hypothetical protein
MSLVVRGEGASVCLQKQTWSRSHPSHADTLMTEQYLMVPISHLRPDGRQMLPVRPTSPAVPPLCAA